MRVTWGSAPTPRDEQVSRTRHRDDRDRDAVRRTERPTDRHTTREGTTDHV